MAHWAEVPAAPSQPGAAAASGVTAPHGPSGPAVPTESSSQLETSTFASRAGNPWSELSWGQEPGGSAGMALPDDIKHELEGRLDVALDGVRLHTGSEAARFTKSIGARAVTVGQNIYFAPGALDFGSQPGRRLIFHEVFHVKQGAHGQIPDGAAGRVVAPDHSLERDAESFETKASEHPGRKPHPASSSRPARSTRHTAPARGDALLRKRDPDLPDNRLQPPDKSFKPLGARGVVYQETGANLRGGPSDKAPLLSHCPQNTSVVICAQGPGPGGWFLVSTPDNQLGYMFQPLIWFGPPMEGAKIYKVRSGDTPEGIIKAHYPGDFEAWGMDRRFAINALAYVNLTAMHNGSGAAGFTKAGNDPTNSWDDAKAVANVYIWVPPASYLKSIFTVVRQKGGGTGSISYDLCAAIGEKVGGIAVLPAFAGGLLHGFVGSVVDAISELLDLLRKLFTGELLDDLKKLFDALKKLSWEEFKALVTEAAASAVYTYLKRMEDPNPFVSGHAMGYVVGYIVGLIVITIVTEGAIAAVRTIALSTRIGKLLVGLVKRIEGGLGKIKKIAKRSLKIRKDVGRVRKLSPALARIDEALIKRLLGRMTVEEIGLLHEVSGESGLRLLQRIAALEQRGKVHGLNDWIDFVFREKKKVGGDLKNTVGELHEAERLAAQTKTGELVHVGGDAKKGLNPGAPQPKSFDITMQRGNVVTRNIEVMTLDKHVQGSSDFMPGLSHAVEKAGAATDGKIEASIRCTLKTKVSQGGNTRLVSANGTFKIVDASGVERGTGDYLEALAKSLNTNPANQKKYALLDQVNIIDEQTNKLIGTLVREGNQFMVRR